MGDALQRGLDKINQSIAAHHTAADLAEQARDLLAAAATGSTQADAEQTCALLTRVIEGISEPQGQLLHAGDRRRRDSFLPAQSRNRSRNQCGPALGRLARSRHRVTRAAGSGCVTRSVPAERLDALRRELPPPIKSTDSGRKTHGRWIGPDGVAQPITSGVDDDSRAAGERLRQLGILMRPTKASDVEMKVAARMVRDGIRHATVLINNTPCRGRLSCDTLVPIMLPDGATLTVHGVNEDGTLFRKRYAGGARPWWR
ncbi:hypothetical protein LFM09_44515 [Lentzea alba]|uniref:DddA-like double-stranded DNA deaminase toxin n=1 Tax=Lentzea alba TaxID=2714351 RepID=UPI0039BED42F